MGCGGTKTKYELTLLETPLDYWMRPLHNLDLNSDMIEGMKLIKDAEECRSGIVDELNDVSAASGAIAYKNRNLTNNLRCVLWRLGVDNDGKIEAVKIEEGNFSGEKNSEEGNAAGNKFFIYYRNLDFKGYGEKTFHISCKLKDLFSRLTKNMEENSKTLFEEFNDKPAEGFILQANLKENLAKIKNANNCLNELKDMVKGLSEDMRGVNSVFESIANEAPKCLKAFQQKLTDPVQIAWSLVEKPEERHGKNWKDCFEEHKFKLKMRVDQLSKLSKLNEAKDYIPVQ